MDQTVRDAPRLKVYIAYSGADVVFTNQLIQGLRADGRFEISVDPDCTIDENDWKNLIGTLVADADAVVVVLSPDSVEACKWEVEYAQGHSKRIVPVLCSTIGTSDMPAGLPFSSCIRFDLPSALQNKPIKALVNMLSADADWLQEHTRLLANARMWDTAGRPSDMLLKGKEAVSAKMWTLSRPDGAPKPTDLHIDFITMSEAVAVARASAAHAIQAEREELETLAHLNSQNDGFQRFAKQAYMVVGCWLAALTLFADWKSAEAMKQVKDARSYVLESCKPSAASSELAMAVSAESQKSAKCQTRQANHQFVNCLPDDSICARAQN